MTVPLRVRTWASFRQTVPKVKRPVPPPRMTVTSVGEHGMKLPQLLLLCGIALAWSSAHAQPDYKVHATPLPSAKVDPAIARAIAGIQPRQIEETIKTLVGFGTRNTLTSMDTDLPPGQGINAAADWIAGQFESIS